MVLLQQPKALVVALAVFVFSSLRPTSAGYVRPRALAPRASTANGFTCDNARQSAACPTPGFEASRSSFGFSCFYFAFPNIYTCNYSIFGDLSSGISTGVCPSRTQNAATICDGAGGTIYICQTPLVIDGVTTCTNPTRKRNGVDRSPDWERGVVKPRVDLSKTLP